jgi:hypothetical protein
VLAFKNGRKLVGVNADAWAFQVSNYSVLRRWFDDRTHWTAPLAQSKQAIAIVSAVHEIVSMESQLNGLLSDAIATS